MNKVRYEPVIGLEIHVQLKTASKMFCRCSADIWGEKPNTHTCPVCLGLPGALPFSNQDAIEKALKVGLALNCKPRTESKFDRKNYFYPDLPKGFQISQYDLPFSEEGFIEIDVDGKKKKIGVIRAHLEEDTGKLIHAKVNGKNVTLIDFNRSGIPLMEIVSAPDMRTATEAKQYAVKIQQIVRYLGVSDADMEKGSLRVEPNVSLFARNHTNKHQLPNYKVELKNINSFRSVEKAIEYEIKRQSQLLDRGEKPVQETRGWDEVKFKTYSQRTKEEAQDYRYFPEPDLPPIEISAKLISNLKKTLPEMPDEKRERFVKTLKLSVSDSITLTENVNLSRFFEDATLAFAQTKVKGTKFQVTPEDAEKIANWVKGEVLRNLNELGKDISEVEFSPADLAEVVYLVEKREITSTSAKAILGKWMIEGVKPAQLIQTLKTGKFTDKELERIVKNVISKNPKAVADFNSGKKVALSFLIGQVQKETRGVVPIEKVKTLLLLNLTPTVN